VEWISHANFKIIGVVKDMVTHSAYDAPQPTLFYLPRWQQLSVVNIKINPLVSAHDAISKITAVFKKYDPSTAFNYTFVDEVYAKKFADEERIGKLASCFAGLAIFISCLGLFGMAMFMAERRNKEIGIRKVLGATVFSLWQLLSKDFVVLVAIAFLIAVPVAYYFMNSWLQQYTYRTHITWWVFGAAGSSALIITLLTVSFQSVKAAVANPVKSLRSE
jgi:putative ABC transport system permease protein